MAGMDASYELLNKLLVLGDRNALAQIIVIDLVSSVVRTGQRLSFARRVQLRHQAVVIFQAFHISSGSTIVLYTLIRKSASAQLVSSWWKVAGVRHVLITS